MTNEKAPREGRGYVGRILSVDLTERSATREEVPAASYERYLSGVGLGARILWERMPAGADVFGPDNLLGLVTGLLTDTGSLFTGRFLAVGRSPQTGGWGDANCGGHFSPYLKRCGVDGVFFRGVSEHPVYLFVDERTAELRDARDLWGLDAVEAEQALRARHGERCQVAVIGQGGERRSYIAGICNDGGRIAARGGLGAVMGAKNLKAVVAAGRSRVGVVDRDRMTALTRAFKDRVSPHQRVQQLLGDRMLGLTGRLNRLAPILPRQPADLWRQLLFRYGTPALTAMSAESGDSPIRNWGGSGPHDFPLSRAQRIGAEAVIACETEKYGCYSCPLSCGGHVRMEGGPWPVERMHKPEYETLCALGGLLLNADLPSIFKANDLCNRAGIDTISCGGVVAFAMECFEAGVLTVADTDGLVLRWGDGAAMVHLVEKIVRREGIGEVLADGVKPAAARIGRGAERFAVHCGGVEAPMHDPKFDPGQAVSYGCDPTPGRHTIAAYQYLELQVLEKQFSRVRKLPLLALQRSKYRFDDKVGNLAADTFYKMLVDGCGACLFGTQVGADLPLVDWCNAATGWDRSPDDYLRAGERIHQLRHAFNVREGLNELRDFRPHPRVLGHPPPERGPSRGVRLDLDAMGRAFYEALHWNPEDGRPDPAWLASLGMADVAAALAP